MEQVFHVCGMPKQNPAGGDMFPLIRSTSTFVQGHSKAVIAEMTAGVPLPSHSEIVFPGSKLLSMHGLA